MEFKRSISPFALWLTAIGGIIGSGWLFGPMFTAQIAGPAAIISWIIGGVLMIIVGLTFAELGSAFPVAGGMVRFAQYSHGPLLSFTIGWLIWLSSVIVAPVETLAIVQYLANYFPSLMHEIANTHVLSGFGIFVAGLIMLSMCVLNWYGAMFFSRSSSVLVIIKLIIPILTALTLIYLDFHASNFNRYSGFMPYGWQSVLAALPLGGVIYSFLGYTSVLQLAEESKNPQRAIPIAIIGSLSFCILLYVLLQVAFVGALKPEYLLQGWKNLHFSGDAGPFAGLLTVLGVTWLVIIIYGGAILSPFGTAYIYTTATARVNYSLSRIGFFPAFFQKLTKRGVPMYGIIVNFIVGMFLFLPFPGWQDMVSFIVSCFVVAYIIGPIALMALRRSNPSFHRPFRLPCAYFLSMLAFYICNLLIFWTGWDTVSRLLIAMAVGFIVFIIHCYRDATYSWRAHWRHTWWLIPYLIGLGVMSYLGTFGGGIKKLAFGWDFLVIAVFSIIIYGWAVQAVDKTALKDLDLKKK